MNEQITWISGELADFSPVILYVAIISGLLLYKWLDGAQKALLVYVVVFLVTDMLSRYFGWLIGNNLFILYIYSLAETLFMVFFYKRYMIKRWHFLLKIILAAIVSYMSVEFCVFMLDKWDIKQFQPYAKVVGNFGVILLALIYLYEKMNHYTEEKWGNFRMNMVFLVFFTLDTLIWLPVNFLVNAGNVKFYFWMVHIALIVLMYLYLTFEIWKGGIKGLRASLK